MDVFEAVADPVRRAILESLTDGARTAGDLASDFSISRPAVSRHLRVLREAELLSVDIAGRQWVYRLSVSGLGELDDWLGRFRGPPDPRWQQRFDALETEVRRTTRERNNKAAGPAARKATA